MPPRIPGIVPFFIPDNILIYVIVFIWALATLPQTMVAVGFSVVNAVSGPEGRYELMSRRWSILGITTAIAVAIAAQVLDWIGFHLNYQVVFIALSMGGLIIYYFSSRIQISDTDPVATSPQRSIKSSVREYFLLINQEPAFVSFTLKRFVYLFGITLATPLFPLYFARELNASDAWIGFLYTAQTAILVVGYFFWTRLAEPIAMLYEQGKIHHVGFFPALEDEMCSWNAQTKESPNRIDALVHVLTTLMIGTQPPPEGLLGRANPQDKSRFIKSSVAGSRWHRG